MCPPMVINEATNTHIHKQIGANHQTKALKIHKNILLTWVTENSHKR